MHDASLTPEAETARCGGPAALAAALQASRDDTLATFAACERALPRLQVPLHAELNPPLWELGHIGWFQEYWLARNPARHDGPRADPDAPRGPPQRANADALYNSSRVPHDTRWSLPLPDAAATRADLAQQLERTLQLLGDLHDTGDDALYFFRLALLHEDMHHEAALYMAQALGIPMADTRWAAPRLPSPPAPIALPTQDWTLGRTSSTGFAFDNELGRATVRIPDTTIGAQVLRWRDYLASQPPEAPRYVRRDGSSWRVWRHGRWQALDLDEPAVHLTQQEALAWCRWAGRRLPTEAEWECAALQHPGSFRWGDVWEWTASPFAPFDGFVPHPYRDYSAPWFDGRPVLRGASFMTQPRMRHPRYRNFFPAHRNDVPAGFRTCAA